MSIEKDLKTLADNSTRIAHALEGLLAKFDYIGQPAPAPPVAEQPVATPPAPPAATPQPSVAPQAPPAPVTPAAPVITPEELNNALIVEFKRLGGREKIDAVIRELGAATITDLPAEQYQPLLAKVQAIPA